MLLFTFLIVNLKLRYVTKYEQLLLEFTFLIVNLKQAPNGQEYTKIESNLHSL